MKSLPAEISVMVSIYRVDRIRWRKGEGQVRERAVSRVGVGFLGRTCDIFIINIKDGSCQLRTCGDSFV